MDKESKTIAEIKQGNIVISISEFNGVKYLDIRKYFKTEEGELQPTKKGIALSKVQFQELLTLLNSKKEEIEGLF